MSSRLKIYRSKLKNVYKIPTSKSYANRALILAALDKDVVRINNYSSSSDFKNLLKILKIIGLQIMETEEFIEIQNSFPQCELITSDIIKLNAGDGGTTSRFITALLALGENTYELSTEGLMSERPMDELYSKLIESGTKIIKLTPKSFPVRIKGPLTFPQNLLVDCGETTQFFTSLLLISYIKPVELIPHNAVGSLPYIEMSHNIVDTFSNINSLGHKNIEIPLDMSSLAYVLVYSIITKQKTQIRCRYFDKSQADYQVIPILNHMYGRVFHITDEYIETFPPDKLTFVDINCENFPDLVPTLFVLAAYSHGISKLRNIKSLKYKESDRIQALLNLAQILSIECQYNSEDDYLEINGPIGAIAHLELALPHDHRMVMIASMFLMANNGGSITPASAINKSFPEFFENFESC